MRTVEDFWRNTHVEGNCIVYNNRGSNGYGSVRWRGSWLAAHRLSWQLVCGPIPEGAFVCHSCDRPGCIRPDHLFLGDHRANVEDMHRKGRAHHPRRLTTADVECIRDAHSTGRFTLRELAERFQVRAEHVSKIVRGLTRRDAP